MSENDLAQRLRDSVDSAEVDAGLLRQIVQGDDETIVTTEGGDVKSLAKAIKDLEDEYLNNNILVGSQAARDKAEQWANEEEDVPVETSPDKFSAKHWAEKANSIFNENGDIPAIVIHRSGTAAVINDIVLEDGEIAVVMDGGDVAEFRVGDGVTAGGLVYNSSGLPLVTDSYIVAVPGDDLAAKYNEAKALTPGGSALSATNRARLIIMPGTYTLSALWTADTNFVDVIGLGAGVKDPKVVISGNTISIPDTVTDAKFEGISVGTQNFRVVGITPASNDKRVFTNCTGGNNSFAEEGAEASGALASGTFTNCTGGDNSFGRDGAALGTFTNCTGGNYSFGGEGAASGTFTNCTGGIGSFGAYGEASGTFTNCTGGDYSFGSYWKASGTFENCTGGNYSFAGNGTASGTFENCTGGNYSFSGDNGTASGTFTNCTGGSGSFGGNGTLSGKLYYCRLTSGTFETPTGSGLIRLSIDGTDAVVNADPA